ncbi:MAG: transposase family protein [Planctomycetaceae bacterium]
MSESSATGLLQFLQQVPDPRGREGQRHSHVAMLAALICATLCGFPGYAGVAQWIRLLR